MSSATLDAPRVDVNKLASWEDYEAEKALRADKLLKERPLMRECLDPNNAARYEAQKERFDYKVECTYMLPSAETGMPEEKSATHTVRAQNHNEAWAMFCDRIKHWPSPSAVTRTITKLPKGK